MKQAMIKRRRLLQGAQLALVTTMLPSGAVLAAEVSAASDAYEDVREGRIILKTPALAENGNSVPMTVSVDSPMTADDYVQQISVYAPKNPVPLIARFTLTPNSGEAVVSTRMRFSDSQVVTAIAQMSDGTLWQGSSETTITLAACVEPLL